ncbi:MAG: hypothetical protein ACE366_05685 [Bradymonadia bacterium]
MLAGALSLFVGVFAGCDVTTQEDVQLDIRLYTPAGQESLLEPGSSRVAEIEVVAVQADAPNSSQRVEIFRLDDGSGGLNQLPIGPSHQLFIRGFSADDSLLFYGASRPFDVEPGSSPRKAVVVGPTSCVVANTGAPEGYTSAGGNQDMGPVRVGHTATPLPDGRVLIMGGARMESGLISEIYDTMEIYDPDEGLFQTLDIRMQSARAWHTATVMEDGRILVVGGLANIDGRQTPVKTIALVDLADEDQPVRLVEGLFPEGEQRYRHTATRLDDGSGSVLISGGYGATRSPLASTWRYFPSQTADPTEGTFRRQGDMCQARVEHSTSTLFFQGGRAQAVAAGGLITQGDQGLVPTDSIELFTSNPNQTTGCCGGDGVVPNETQGCWVSPAGVNLERPRFAHQAVNVDDSRQVLFVGGHQNADRSDGITELEMMDANLTLYGAGSVGVLGNAEAGVGDVTASVLPDETVLVVGGRRGGAVTSAAYQLVPLRDPEGAVRPQVNPNDPPIARYGSAPLGAGCTGEPRYEHEAVTMSTGNVLIVGGITQGGGAEVTTRRAEVFFPLVSDLPAYYPNP